MRYIAETTALVAALSATGAEAAPAQNNRLFNNPSFGILPYTGNPAYYADPKDFVGRTGPAKRDAWPAFAEAQVGTAADRAWIREQYYPKSSGKTKREAFIDNQPKVIPHPGGIEAAIAEARRLYPEIYQRDAQGFGLEDFLGLPGTSVNPNFGNTGTFGKRSADAFIDNMPKVVQDPNFSLQEYLRNRRITAKPLQQREANAFFDNQPKVVYDKNFKDIVYNNRSPFQLQQRAAEADPFLGDIMKLVGMVIDKTTKRDAVADPFLADIAKLGGMIIDKVTKRDAVADPFFADIVKLGGMIIDKTTKRNAAADPFLGDIMKLVGMVIDKTT